VYGFSRAGNCKRWRRRGRRNLRPPAVRSQHSHHGHVGTVEDGDQQASAAAHPAAATTTTDGADVAATCTRETGR